MALFTDLGRDELNRYALGITNVLTMTVRLFANAYLPTIATITANFVEVAPAYYQPYAIDPTEWTANDSPGLTRYDYPQITWTFIPYLGPAFAVYGFFVTSDQTGNTIFAEAAIVPFPVPLTGGELCLTLSWTDQNA